MKTIAILSGDIIASSDLNKEQRKVLEDVLWTELRRLSGGDENFSIQRGDAFQFKATEPVQALAIAIELRCILKSKLQQDGKALSDARISIGIGSEDLKGRTVSSSDGEAYRLSGLGLDQQKDDGVNLKISTGQEIFNKAWEPLSFLIDEHISNWSAFQAEAVLLRLAGETYESMATHLGINTSAAFKRIESARWTGVKKALHFFEYMMEKIKTNS